MINLSEPFLQTFLIWSFQEEICLYQKIKQFSRFYHNIQIINYFRGFKDRKNNYCNFTFIWYWQIKKIRERKSLILGYVITVFTWFSFFAPTHSIWTSLWHMIRLCFQPCAAWYTIPVRSLSEKALSSLFDFAESLVGIVHNCAV